MNQGLTVVQTARVVGELRWSAESLFGILTTWASEADRSAIAVVLATSGRHLGWHAADLGELVPDAVLLGDEVEVTPRPELVAALEAIRAIPGSVERLAVAHRVLLGRLAARCVAVSHRAAPHADAPLLRQIEFCLADLRRDRDEGEMLLVTLLSDIETVERVGRRVIEAESRLVAAGGLFHADLP